MSVRETSAIPVGLRSRVPAKITSSMRTPRRLLADCSPSTQEIASEILDLPQPLGPTTAAMPSPGNFSSVRSQKDLNPRICNFFSLSNFPTPSEIGQSQSPMQRGGFMNANSVGLSAGVEVVPVPVNVPSELTGVKPSAHNMLWINSRTYSISHNVCTTWPKIFPMRCLTTKRRGESDQS